MPADAKVLSRAAAVLVADVTFTDITCQDEDFLGRVKEP
jgi:hypothetical protein